MNNNHMSLTESWIPTCFDYNYSTTTGYINNVNRVAVS